MNFDSYKREQDDWCFQCEQFHGPMDYGDGCYTERDVRTMPRPLPWAPSFGFLTGRQCRARLTRAESGGYRRWGRCELRYGHVGADNTEHVDHALEYGLIVLRWPAWTAKPHEPYAENGFGR